MTSIGFVSTTSQAIRWVWNAYWRGIGTFAYRGFRSLVEGCAVSVAKSPEKYLDSGTGSPTVSLHAIIWPIRAFS